MRTKHENWAIEKLTRCFDKIEFPEFQREPTVWNLEKKQRLIDSILRGFDISSIYFAQRKDGFYDCIDGRQRINAILSYMDLNGDKDADNAFHLRIENEIFNDEDRFQNVDSKRFRSLAESWQNKIKQYKLNIVILSDVEYDEELNLLFLRLQIASVLNAGEKLNAMIGDMRDLIFHDICKHDFFKGISIPVRRFAKEQVAAQIVLNVFSKRDTNSFRRSRYTDLQDFFKQHSKLEDDDNTLIREIKSNLSSIKKHYGSILQHIKNRALAVSLYIFMSQLIDKGVEDDIAKFKDFILEFLKTLKWQIPLNVKMNPAYHDLLNFQNYVSQAAGEKYAIQKRHDFLNEYFYYYKKNGVIKGDIEYGKTTKKNAAQERKTKLL